MSSERLPRALRRQIADRARWRCEYCLSPAAFSTQPFEVDHVIPRSKGGLTNADNLALSCGCNSYKGHRTHGRDPRTARVLSLFNPRAQRWPRHFAWSAAAISTSKSINRAAISRTLPNVWDHRKLSSVRKPKRRTSGGKNNFTSTKSFSPSWNCLPAVNDERRSVVHRAGGLRKAEEEPRGQWA
jgi:hypothetical protein